MIVFVFNFFNRIFIDWSMKLVRSAYLCHVFQYLSDIHIKEKKKKGKDKEIQIVNRKESMITLLSLFSRRFPTKFLLLTGIAEVRLIPRTYHCKTNYEIQHCLLQYTKAPGKSVPQLSNLSTKYISTTLFWYFTNIILSC